MLSRKQCKICKEPKVHIKDGNPTGNGYKYRDLSGSTWNGRICPDCKKSKRREDYTLKSSARKCEICGEQLKGKQRKYCSKKCANVANKPYRKKYRDVSERDRKSRREAKRLRKRACRRRKLKCVPWSHIADYYDKCPENYEVDHIIPLNGELVSGLHVPWNFQYLTKEDNNKKLNTFDGTYDNEGWRF